MKKLEILHEDDHIVVVNKPPGVLSIPDRFTPDLPNVKTILEKKYGEVFVVHRIDRYTSGVMIFAKDAESHKHLSEQWMERTPVKFYSAIVDGVPKEVSGEINESLAESTTKRGKMLVHSRGKESRSSYHVEEAYNNYSLVDVRIYTGRMHQIRVHMAHIGHPLVVDKLYGKREQFFLSEIKGKKYKKAKYDEERPLLTRQPLHARKLVIDHPATGKSMTFEADLPKDMRAVINQMRKLS